MPDLALDGPEAAAAAMAAADPWADRRARLLDHLLALQGEAFPQHALRAFDLYRGPGERAAALVANRVRLLGEIAVLNRDRAAAPDYLRSERCHSVGIGRKLSILLDYPDRSTAPLSAPLRRAGLVLGAVAEGLAARAGLAATDDPLAALVPRREAAPIAAEALVAGTPFLAGRRLPVEALHRGVGIGAYVLTPEAKGWRLWLDPGAGPAVLACGGFATREAAVERANQLRAFLVGLNRQSEGLYVVEDGLVGGAPLGLTVVQAGWTARTAAPEFRRLAEETVALVCPAHLVHRVVWLGAEDMAAFEALHTVWRVAFREAAGGGGEGLVRAGLALREFLAEAGR
jgi:hypothetical protein